MRLEQLTLKNLRLFGDEEQTINFSADKNITIFLGDNGAGKTTILHGCTVVLSNYFLAFPEIGNKVFTETDVRAISNAQRADFAHIGLSITTDTGQGIHVDQYRKGNSTATPKSNLTQIKEYASSIKDKIDANECVVLPILAYYGTERGQIQAPERRRDFNSVFPRWDSYSGALEPATNFKRFFTWFERNEDEERREREVRRDWHYSSYALDAVRSALNQIDENYYRPRVLTSPLRFVMDDISELSPNDRKLYKRVFSTSVPPAGFEEVNEVRIEQMSDGYRIMIAMIADIAARMAEANPSPECSGLDNPLNTPGIVFIDEIDLHLHPQWQRRVLAQLHKIFPNVQFIVTTHSPNVVLGTLDIAQVVTLENGIINSNVDMAQFQYYDINQLLLSDLFKLENVRSDKFEDIENERKQLLHKESELTEEEKARLKYLDNQVSIYLPGEGEEMRRTRLLLEQIVNTVRQ